MLIRLLGDLLSPPRCAACEGAVQRSYVFCAGCAASVERCEPSGDPGRDPPGVDVAFGFYGGALTTAVRRLKYEDRPHLARPLGELLRGACRAARVTADAVVPVPLHPRRLAERGYNQAALLGGHVATELGAPLFARALTRVVDTVPQVELSGEGRQTNVGSAFVVTPRARIEGRTLALVDDVSTTGATLGACRRALLDAGARCVIGVVVARTSSSALKIPPRLDSGATVDVRITRSHASSGCAFMPLRANLRN